VRIAWCLLCLLSFSANAFGQNLLWDVVEDFSGGTDLTRAITLSKNAAIFIGNASNPANEVNDFVIQSLRRRDGSARWSDRVPSYPGVLTGLQIASSQGRVFASGYAPGATPGSTDIVVRAYEALTGTLLWNSVWDTGRDDLPQAIAAGPAAVVVVGYGGNTPGHALDFIVRAYDPISGAVLWDDRVDRSDLDTAAWTVAITRNRVFVAGNTLISAGRDLLVRAYSASSGALVWETTRPLTSPVAMKVIAGRVFLAGSSSNRSYVGALDAKSGALLWEDDATEPGIFRDIAVEGDRVVAAGSSGSALLVRAYDAPSGTIEWQDQTSVPPGSQDFATAVGLNNRAVYVAGSSGQDFLYSEMLVRGYDAVAGTLLWDDRSHRSLSPPGATAVDMALGKNRLFVAGYALGVGTQFDFVIRAYGVRNDGTAPQLESVSR
jgi:outer membrane protein assembly factor BamB